MTSLIGTEAELKQGYRYGLDKRLDTRDDKAEKDIQDKVRRRIQGAFFRALQMREVGNETIELQIKEGWKRPNASVSKLILSEVCTGPEISKGTTPTFCRGQWAMGKIVPMNESIDLSEGNISAQIEAAQPHIVSMIVDQRETPKLSTILQGY